MSSFKLISSEYRNQLNSQMSWKILSKKNLVEPFNIYE